ncbi:hypothetical protein, partial [Agrobacterium pusense]|uniref:hypothetical protein n=1 Tax=Agrobacterium pusense TaxID=648995 RepID=UPI002FE09607
GALVDDKLFFDQREFLVRLGHPHSRLLRQALNERNPTLFLGKGRTSPAAQKSPKAGTKY